MLHPERRLRTIYRGVWSGTDRHFSNLRYRWSDWYRVIWRWLHSAQNQRQGHRSLQAAARCWPL